MSSLIEPLAVPHSASPGRRAWLRFKRNRLGYVSLIAFVFLLALSVMAELVSNDRPLLVVYQGQVALTIDGSDTPLTITAQGTAKGWDTYAMPANTWRSYQNTGDTSAVVLVMTPGDHRKNLVWDDAVVAAAGSADRAIDANGYVASKRFVDRSQR